MIRAFILFLILLLNFNFSKSENINNITIIDVIRKNQNLSEFNKYLKLSQLDQILDKNTAWNWTIFAPNNEAFDELKKVNKNLFDNIPLIRNLLMDHILIGKKSSKNLNEISNEITVSNKPLQLFNENQLYVKDMVVINEDYSAKNGVIHSIACVMFVQPSIEDDRLSENLQKTFPITSCCMRNEQELNLWKSSLKSR